MVYMYSLRCCMHDGWRIQSWVFWLWMPASMSCMLVRPVGSGGVIFGGCMVACDQGYR